MKRLAPFIVAALLALMSGSPAPAGAAAQHVSGGRVVITVGTQSAELPRVETIVAENNASSGMKNFMAVAYQKTNNVHQTIAWGIVGLHAPTTIHAARPSFIVGFNGMPGVDATQYVPVLIRFSPYKGQGRIGATTDFQLDMMTPHFSFKDPQVPTRTTILEEGEMQMSPVHPLPAGDYAIVLRPKDEKYLVRDEQATFAVHFAGTPAVAVQPWQYAWDFTVDLPSGGCNRHVTHPPTPDPVTRVVPCPTPTPRF